MPRFFVVALVCTIVLTGCSEAVSPTVDSDDAEGRSHAIIAYGRLGEASSRARSSESDEVRAEYARLRAEALDIAGADEPLTLRDRRLRALLVQNEDFALSHYLNQFVAVQILREAVRRPDASSLESIDYFTTVLIDTGSPEAELIHTSLSRLKGRWNDVRIHAAADLTATRALSWAERVCSTCIPNATLPREQKTEDLKNLDAKRLGILQAAEQLRQLAGP